LGDFEMNLSENTKTKKTNILMAMANSSNTGVLGVVLVLVILLSSFTRDFFTITNFDVIVSGFTITALVGLSQMVILAGGGMNVSVGAIGGLVGVITGGCMDKLGLPVALSIIIGLITGLLCGVLNGYLISRRDFSGVTAFLITLATSAAFAGINLGISNATPFYNLPDSYKFIGYGKILGIQILLWVCIIVFIICGILFRHLSIGRQILSVGGNIKAAELSGVPIHKVIILSNIFSGLISATAAILLVARLTSAQPDVGSNWMLFSFAAPLIGGTRLAGGKVNVLGAFLGALVLNLIQNGLVHLNINAYWMELVQGAIIFAAVAIDRIRSLTYEKTGSGVAG